MSSVWKYRYGVVLRKLDLIREAVEVFVEAIHALPLHWGAWLELGNLVTNNEMVKRKKNSILDIEFQKNKLLYDNQ